MSHYVGRFPDGAAGLGLLTVRLCYAPLAFGIVALPPMTAAGAMVLRLVAGMLALLLVAGFATRVAAFTLGVAVLMALVVSTGSDRLLLIGHAGGCAAMALLGAGAYSIDARRHGHRVIHLTTRPPDRGGGD